MGQDDSRDDGRSRPRTAPDLRGHRPSGLARRRAERAGLDLERLREEAPDQYRMLNAEELARVSPELAEVAAQLVWRSFPDHELYRVPSGAHERLLVFPPLDAEGFDRFDEAAAELVTRDEYERRHAFFRVVRDLRGERRELMLPTPPDAWAGDAALVGPFPSEEAAQQWLAGRLPVELIGDPLPYRGAWFCDVFPSEEGQPLAGSGASGGSGSDDDGAR